MVQGPPSGLAQRACSHQHWASQRDLGFAVRPQGQASSSTLTLCCGPTLCAACAVLTSGAVEPDASPAGSDEVPFAPVERIDDATQDRKAQYQLQMDEEGILLAAANILSNACGGWATSQPRAGRQLPGRPLRPPAARSLRRRLPRHQAPHPGHRALVHRHHQQLRSPQSGGRQARPGTQCGRRHPLPQPSERESGAQ